MEKILSTEHDVYVQAITQILFFIDKYVADEGLGKKRRQRIGWERAHPSNGGERISTE